MTVILILIQFAKSFSALSFVMISGFAKNANFSNDIFKYETRMSPHAMKVQQIGHKCYAANPSKKSENSKTSIDFFTYSQLQYKLCDLISDCYCVTLPSPQVAKWFYRSKFGTVWPPDTVRFTWFMQNWLLKCVVVQSCQRGIRTDLSNNQSPACA